MGTAIAGADDFPPPPGMPADAAAVWSQVVPELAEIGMVRSVDALVLESLCRHVARARAAEAYLHDLGEHRMGAPLAMCRMHVELGAEIADTDDCRGCAHERNAPAMPSFMHQGHRGATVHPAVRVARDAWAAALRIAGEYGMTAVGRLKVGAAVLKQRSLADELRDLLDDPAEEIEAEVVAAKPKAKRKAPAKKPAAKKAPAKKKSTAKKPPSKRRKASK